MHIADPDTGNLGANAIVGGSAGIATGAAFSAKRLGADRVAVCFFGEGALGQGVLYEVMNLAALWKLPMIYVCENNLYNDIATRFSETTAGDNSPAPLGLASTASSASMDDRDVRRRKRRRRKNWSPEPAKARGPSFLSCNTHRYRGHHVGDVNRDLPHENRRAAVDGRARPHQAAQAIGFVGGKAREHRALGKHREGSSQSEIDSGRQVCHRRPIPTRTKSTRMSMPEAGALVSGTNTAAAQRELTLGAGRQGGYCTRKCGAIPLSS